MSLVSSTKEADKFESWTKSTTENREKRELWLKEPSGLSPTPKSHVRSPSPENEGPVRSKKLGGTPQNGVGIVLELPHRPHLFNPG